METLLDQLNNDLSLYNYSRGKWFLVGICYKSVTSVPYKVLCTPFTDPLCGY